MPTLERPLSPPSSQLDGLRSAMLDLQTSIRDYYRETAAFGADADALATRVRSCVSFVQVLNEFLRKQTSRSIAYRSMFQAPEDPRVGLIRGFEYVRHVTQHIPYPVRPGPTSVVGGNGLGFRTYATWQDIPSSAHERLTRDSRLLKPCYDELLRGREVTDTLLDAARFFSEVCPSLVNRQANGEWRGFPLRHQAGVPSRLHPEEPVDQSAALGWMASRRPGGDLRVICGSLAAPEGDTIIFGLTFTARCAFVPFFETAGQVDADIALGFDYCEGDIAANTFETSTLARSVLCSEVPVKDWAGARLTVAPVRTEHATFGSVEVWREMWFTEGASNAQAFITRRERRLNASVPHD